MTRGEEEIQGHLDESMRQYLAGGLPADERMSLDGQIRGLSIALAVMRGTSGMAETAESERRVVAVR